MVLTSIVIGILYGTNTIQASDNNEVKEVYQLTGYGTLNDVAFSHNGDMLAVTDGKGPYIYNTNNFELLRLMKGHTKPVWCVAWSPDDKWVASGSADNTVRVWDIATGNEQITLTGHNEPVSDLAWSPNGALFATSSADGSIRIWDLETQQVLTVFETSGWINSIAWSPDGRSLVSGGNDSQLRIWDIDKERQLHSLDDKSPIWDVAWITDAVIASAGATNQIHLWNTSNGETLRILKGHSAIIHGIACSPDKTMVVSVSGDLTARIWDINTGELIETLKGHTNWVWSVDWSSNGGLIASAGREGIVRLWNTNDLISERKGVSDKNMEILKSAKTPQELYVIAYQQEKTNRQFAIAAYQEILDRFPSSDVAIKAIDRLDRLESTEDVEVEENKEILVNNEYQLYYGKQITLKAGDVIYVARFWKADYQVTFSSSSVGWKSADTGYNSKITPCRDREGICRNDWRSGEKSEFWLYGPDSGTAIVEITLRKIPPLKQ